MLKKIQNMWRQSAFGKNALAYGIGNIGSRAASFLLIPIYTRSLSLADYGLLATLLAVTQILVILIDAGLRTITYYRTDSEATRFIMGPITAAVLLLTFSSIFLIIFHEGVKAALMAQVVAYGGLWLFLAVAVLRQTGVGLSAEIASVLVRYGSPLILVMSGRLITDTVALFLLGLQESRGSRRVFAGLQVGANSWHSVDLALSAGVRGFRLREFAVA